MKNCTPPFARLGRCALLAGIAGLALPALASATPRVSGFNIGGGAGSNSLNGEDYTGNGNDVSDTQLSYKALAGFRLNEIVSLEPSTSTSARPRAAATA